MLTQIFVAILVLMVAFAVTRDLVKTKSEYFLGHQEGSGRETLPRTVGDTRGDLAGGSFREPFGTTVPAAGYNVGGHPEPIGPPAGIEPSRTSSPSGQSLSARQDGLPAANGNRHVRSRLRLLVIIPAAAVAVLALCVVGLAGILGGTRINSSSSSARDEAILGAVALGVVIVVVVVLAVRATIATARSVLQPLYRLRTRALALAAGRPSDPSPADVASPDEMGDIARALEQMGSRISLPAGEEVGLRNRLDAMFVNLSRRSQSLVERQMRLMDNLEQGEQDRDRQAMLFRVNRIAARMHRDSQNLLVLAGHEVSSSWDQPAALMNVLRAATSEVEEYERVSLHPQPEIAVSGPAVDDVVHLLAELIQNATSFSAGDMAVEISGQLLDSGGALISITDRGVGMSAQEMAHANWRLENPPSGDIELPKWIGLIVVARLAARRGVRVRLQQAEFGGLTALVWLPDELIARRDAAPRPRFAGSATTGPRRGSHELAARPGAVPVPQNAAAGRSANLVPPREGTLIAPLGRRLMSEEGRQSDHASAATATTRPIAPVGPAAASASPAGPAAAEAVGSGLPGMPGDQAAAEQGPVSGQEALPVRASAFGSPGGTAQLRQETGSGNGVMVPPTENPAEGRRLPIYDSVESHWFKGGRRTPGPALASANRWLSPADEGWNAAETVESPTAGAPTAVGLPRRVPNANLLPGAIPSAQPVSVPSRSAAEIRDRLAGLQRGTTEGRAAASEAAKPAGDDGS